MVGGEGAAQGVHRLADGRPAPRRQGRRVPGAGQATRRGPYPRGSGQGVLPPAQSGEREEKQMSEQQTQAMTVAVMDDDESLPVPAGGVGMTGLARAEVDGQIETAKRYPRSLKASRNDAMELAKIDVETAEMCFYSFKRAGKDIEGPSVRLAEIIATAWGDLRYGAEILGADDTFVRARGYCFDLQTNTAYAGEVERRITDSKGRRYSDDMVGVTGMAASAIASRNAVFKIVPRVYVNRIYEKAKLTARGTEKTLASRRVTVLEKYAKRGVSAEQVFAKYGIRAIEELTLDHVEQLVGLAPGIHEGRTTIDKEFPPIASAPAQTDAAAPTPQKSAIDQLNDVARKAAGKSEPEAKK